MASSAVPQGDGQEPEPCEVIPTCPICDGKMEKVYDRHYQTVCVCVDCHAGLTVPQSAYEIARVKREAKWKPKPK